LIALPGDRLIVGWRVNMDVFTLTVNILSAIAFPLNIYALWLAFKQIRQATEQEKAQEENKKELSAKLETQLQSLGAIQESLSTRYLDEFPHFIWDIVEAVKSAKKELIILVNVPAYTCFSENSGWFEYQTAIAKQIREKNVRVDLVCANSTVRTELSEIELRVERERWSEWVSRQNNIQKIQRLAQSLGKKISLEECTPDWLASSWEEADIEMLNKTFFGASIHQISIRPSIHCWIVDNNKAIFTFPNYYPGNAYDSTGNSYGFETTDQRLITAFKKLIDVYKAGDFKSKPDLQKENERLLIAESSLTSIVPERLPIAN
jgi:hypothetical protein